VDAVEPAVSAPLAGVRVVVTRPEHQAGDLLEAFRAAGAHAEPLPLIEIGPPDDPAPLERAAQEIDRYDWLVLASANAADALLDRLPAGLAAGLPPGLRTAAIGPATAEALRRRGIEPALVAGDRRAEGLAAELAPHLAPGARILLPQPAGARPVLAAELTRAGAEVTFVIAYAKRLPTATPARARELFGDRDPLGWVTFTSPSIAHAFAGLFGETWSARHPTLRSASIGPVTSEALRQLGVEPAAEAEEAGDAELVRAVARAEAR
jgi:uroporphyrinogen-III synthase